MNGLLILLSAAVVSAGAAGGLQPWTANVPPTDLAKRHVEEIDAGKHQYVIIQGGTKDGENCRSPMSCGMENEGAFEQTWQSNRAVRLENVGQTDVVNPWLSNGRNLFRTIDEIVAAAVAPGMTDKEKALALWFQEIRYRYHFGGLNTELGAPVKVFNVYGYNTCGNDSICLAGLWHQAGLDRVAPSRTMGHCIAQVFFDGRWNLLDGDQHDMFLLRDNETIAGEPDLTRDHDLVKRSHNGGILLASNRAIDESHAATFIYEGEPNGDRNSRRDTTMNMTLRPGEAIVWRWGYEGAPRCNGAATIKYPETICNGLWEYRPDFANPRWKDGAAAVENVRAAADGVTAEPGQEGYILWDMHCPYVFVGGKLEIEGRGAAFDVSLDGRTWVPVERGDLDPFFPPTPKAFYRYRLRCRLAGDARLNRLGIVNDVQMAPLALPGMNVGRNEFVYTDQCQGIRKVRITHEWVERSASRPPAAPPEPIFPAAGGENDGTDVVFQWKEPSDPDGDAIADYHFELSNRADMRWPLSMNFYRLISRTTDRGKAQFTVPAPGLLTPDRTYYWRVRAKDSQGVWGPWSETWSFTARGAAHPVDVVLDFDAARQTGTLRWKPNPAGRQPVKYRVYGSDEKGFSTSDAPYKVVVGATEDVPALEPIKPKSETALFPANFIAEITGTELAVLGGNVELPGANKTYYRVVAVDAHGKRSGPSDYAVAPRPVIFSKPVTSARVGAAYRYTVAANRSLGDLQRNGRDVRGFWHIEKPVYAIERGPAWLAIDPATGVLSGVPDAAGRFDVVVTAVIDREVKQLDEATLKWGQEKIVSTSTERVGAAKQEFTIDATP